MFTQYKYVLIAYMLKGTATCPEIAKYLCETIKCDIKGDTPQNTVNTYVSSNMNENLTGTQHKGNWYVRVDKGKYRLACQDPEDIQSRIAFVKSAKYDDNNKSPVFSPKEFGEIVNEFLAKDSSFNKNKILEYCQIALSTTPKPFLQENPKKDFLKGKGLFITLRHVLAAYALKGDMSISEVTDYLHTTIGVANDYNDKRKQYITEYALYIVRNMRDNNKNGSNHYGNWYTPTSNARYRLDCQEDLKTRIFFAKNAKYYKNPSNVFGEGEFEEIIQKFIDKDMSLDKDKIAEALDQFDLSGVKLYADEQSVAVSVENIYSKEDFLSEVFMTSEKYESLVRILKAKKNIILQGAPGVGKTFAAKRLAYSVMGEKDESRIEFVQFHQNYSYEDFVMGYKPNENGFELKNGIFYSFCQKAVREPEKDYFLLLS